MTLKKELGLKEIIFLSAGAIIGSGIFVIPAIGARILSFNSLWIWLLTGVMAILMSTIFSELTSLYETEGGIYKYVKDAFGEKIGFITGWTSWVIGWATISMLSIAGIDYLSAIIPIPHVARTVIAIFFVLILTIINCKGIKNSGKNQLIFTSFTFLFILFIILIFGSHIDLTQFHFSSLTGWTPILLAAVIIIEPYIGWQEATFLSKETRNSRKIIPKGIFYGTIIVAVLYFFIALTSLGVTHITGIYAFSNSEAPFALLFKHILPYGNIIISAGAVAVIIGCLNSWIIASARLPYGMAKNRDLPSFFKQLNKSNVPQNAMIFQFLISSLIILFGDFILSGGYELILKVMIPLALFIYGITFLALPRLRKKYYRRKSYFKTPLEESTYLISSLYVFALFIFLIWIDISLLLKGLSLIMLGIPFYFLVKLHGDHKFTEKFFDKFSFLWSKLFPLWYQEKEIKSVVNKLKVKKGQTILDFGCGTGITTLELAKKVGENGTVVAVDLSRKQLEKSIKRIEKAMEFSNVIFIKESELTPFHEQTFDAIVGVGILEHFTNPSEMLKNLVKRLKTNGRFSFLSFGKSFGIPAPEHLTSKENIKQTFKEAGLKVNVKKEKKKLTEYWFIYGKKNR